MHKVLPLAASALFVLALTACVAKLPSVVTLIPSDDYLQADESPDYRIGVGDEVELKFFYTPELNDRMTVRADGKISVMFAQNVKAAGRTPDELAEAVKRKMSPHLKQLDLVVIVRTFASQKVYVGGEVSKPGPVSLTGDEDLLQVIDEAGWLLPTADKNELRLIRRNPDGKRVMYRVDLRTIMRGENMEQNLAVKAGDIILAPPSDITLVDRWIDQYIRQIIPVNAGVFVSSTR